MTTIQDRGRPGLAHLGVPPSGAVDRASLELANRLVGNLPGAAGLEITVSGPCLRFRSGAAIALTGAAIEAALDGRPVAMNGPQHVRRGQVLELGVTSAGIRTYLAVRGGIAADPVLGSRSADLLTGLGPRPLQHGDRLGVGEATAPFPGVDIAPVASSEQPAVLRVVLGPRLDWFTPAAINHLLSSSFVVGGDSNRIAARLHGPSLEHAHREELLSEGVITGSLQVPPGGQPILLLNDHPTTGGYPVIAVVIADDMSRAAQLRPGDPVRFATGR